MFPKPFNQKVTPTAANYAPKNSGNKLQKNSGNKLQVTMFSVIAAVVRFSEDVKSNIHRGAYELVARAGVRFVDDIRIIAQVQRGVMLTESSLKKHSIAGLVMPNQV